MADPIANLSGLDAALEALARIQLDIDKRKRNRAELDAQISSEYGDTISASEQHLRSLTEQRDAVVSSIASFVRKRRARLFRNENRIVRVPGELKLKNLPPSTLIEKGKEDELIAWLRKNGLSAALTTKVSINANVLKSHAEKAQASGLVSFPSGQQLLITPVASETEEKIRL